MKNNQKKLQNIKLKPEMISVLKLIMIYKVQRKISKDMSKNILSGLKSIFQKLRAGDNSNFEEKIVKIKKLMSIDVDSTKETTKEK